MLKNDHEYLETAMRAYDNPSCLTVDEFNRDLNQYIHIKKAVRRYHVDNSTLRRLVNQLVIYYNCFGTTGTDLLLYKTKEIDILEVLIPIIMYLGRSTQTVDVVSVTLNMSVITQLSEL